MSQLGPGEDDDRLVVTLTFFCDSEMNAVKCQESLSRVMTGMALEGINGNLSIVRVSAEGTSP